MGDWEIDVRGSTMEVTMETKTIPFWISPSETSLIFSSWLYQYLQYLVTSAWRDCYQSRHFPREQELSSLFLCPWWICCLCLDHTHKQPTRKVAGFDSQNYTLPAELVGWVGRLTERTEKENIQWNSLTSKAAAMLEQMWLSPRLGELWCATK